MTRCPKGALDVQRDFNSHTREGVTGKLDKLFAVFGISTHTPVRV